MNRRRLLSLAFSVGLGVLLWAGATRLLASMGALGPHGGGRGGDCVRCHGAGSEQAQVRARPTPWDIELAPDGRTAYVVAAPLRRVLVVDVEGEGLLGSIGVEGVPAGIGLSPDGRLLAVTLVDRGQVELVDVARKISLGHVGCGRGPRDVAFDAGGRRLVVANGDSADLSVIDLDSGEEQRRPAGAEPFVAVASPDHTLVAVVSRKAGVGPPERVPSSEVTIVEAATGRVRRRVTLPSCHMVEGAAFTPDGTKLLVPALQARNLLPILQVGRGWVMSAVLAVIDVADGGVSLLPLTEPVRGFADPAGIAVSGDGRFALVAAGGNDDAALVDLAALRAAEPEGAPDRAQSLTLATRYVLARTPLASNPRGVAWAAGRFLVTERLNDTLAVLDEQGRLLRRIDLGAEGEDAVRRGERVFHAAGYAFQHAFSCRSCHPGAHTDGLTYDFEIDGVGRNVVLNRSLLGVAGTEPFKWIGLNPTLERQCGPRFAMVLSRADVFPPDAQRDLVSFLHSLPAPSPDGGAARVGGRDTQAEQRGRAIFERAVRKDGTPIPAAGRCITCHPPPHYTSRRKSSVGTLGAGDDTDVFDVPHLTGIASKAPYLHDGRALTLEQIWTLPDLRDRHGVVTDLGKADLNDLIAFLKGL